MSRVDPADQRTARNPRSAHDPGAEDRDRDAHEREHQGVDRRQHVEVGRRAAPLLRGDEADLADGAGRFPRFMFYCNGRIAWWPEAYVSGRRLFLPGSVY